MTTQPGTYVVEVTVASHDDLRAGVLAASAHRVIVTADSDREAMLVASQMASATSDGGMCTSAVLLDWPD